MAPEQLSGGAVSRRVDIYAAAVVLWEALAGRRLFAAKYEAEMLAAVLRGATDPPSKFAPDVPPVLDQLVMRGLDQDPLKRFASAREMAFELERAVPCASPAEIGDWAEQEASDILALRAARIDEIESRPSTVIDVPEEPQKSLGPYEIVAELHKSFIGPSWVARKAATVGPASVVLIRRVSLRCEAAEGGAQPPPAGTLEAAARASMGWQHPRLVPVVDTVVTDSELGVVSQYVEGETLRSLMWLAGIRRAPLAPPIALRICLDLLEGLDYLHGQRLADPAASSCVGLTADDVLVGTDGQARLVEPGLAGAAAAFHPWARHPKRVCYDAPERLREGARVDLRADLFTVGVLLWEMLQNRALFTGSNMSQVSEGILSGIIERVDTSPTVQAQGMVEAVANVVARALERDETRRFQSAAEMTRAIANTGERVANPSEVAQLVERLAASALMVQRQRIAGDGPDQGGSKPRAESISLLASDESPLSSPAMAQTASAESMDTTPSGGRPPAAQPPGLVRPLPAPSPPRVPPPKVNTPAAVATTVYDAKADPDGPTIREARSAEVRRVGPSSLNVDGESLPTDPNLAATCMIDETTVPQSGLPSAPEPEPPASVPTQPSARQPGVTSSSQSGLMGLSVSDPSTGSLADFQLPDAQARGRSRALVVVGAVVITGVVAGAIGVVALGGGAAETETKPPVAQPSEPDRGPAVAMDDEDAPPEPEPSAEPADDDEDPAEKTTPNAKTRPRPTKKAPPKSKPPAKPKGTAKPPPKDKRYYPKAI